MQEQIIDGKLYRLFIVNFISCIFVATFIFKYVCTCNSCQKSGINYLDYDFAKLRQTYPNHNNPIHYQSTNRPRNIFHRHCQTLIVSIVSESKSNPESQRSFSFYKPEVQRTGFCHRCRTLEQKGVARDIDSVSCRTSL